MTPLIKMGKDNLLNSDELTWNLNGNVIVGKDARMVLEDLATTMADAAARAVEERGVFHVALSGGSTPEPFYMLMATHPDQRLFPWHQTHIWIVDERCVPEDDERSNIKMIRESLSEHVPIRRRQVHAMPVMEADPAAIYIDELNHVFINDGENSRNDNDVPRLDFVLLGMGDDAHTASLFPNSDALDVNDAWIAVNDGPHVTPPKRVTMTYPLLNAARELAVLAVGEKKKATIQKIDTAMGNGTATTQELPITGIAPTDGELTWFLDAAAAGQIDEGIPLE